MSGTRRKPRDGAPKPGKTVLANGIPEGAIVNHEPAHAATQVIEPIPAPSLAQDLADGLKAAELGLTDDLGSFAGYTREPVPDLDSGDPADRTEWFLVAGGAEPLFERTVGDLGAEWLLDTSLPVPPRTAPETTEDTTSSGSGSAPPVDEAAAETTPASADPEPVSTEDGEPVQDEPVQDEPDAEPDCAEGSEA